jgi:RimJ/RimL family protein N-acetyltransferase
MYTYNILSQTAYELGSYRISALRLEDMQPIKEWRNAQMDVLRQNRPLTDEGQTRYYNRVVLPTMTMEEPPMVLFSYFLSDDLIGYGGLTNLDWHSRRAEVSFLLNTQRAGDESLYASDFIHFLRLLKVVSFQVLKLNRLFTETFDIRPRHVAILESEGFRYEGCMKQHVRIGTRFVDSLLHGHLKEHYDAEREKSIY